MAVLEVYWTYTGLVPDLYRTFARSPHIEELYYMGVWPMV